MRRSLVHALVVGLLAAPAQLSAQGGGATVPVLLASAEPHSGRAEARAGTITGTITAAATQQPIAGAQVAVVGGAGALTDDRGRYTIRAVSVGRVTLRVRRIGYAPVDKPVDVIDGQTAIVDFALTEQTRTLSEVVVTGTVGATTRREIGNSVASVSMAKLENQPTPQLQDIVGTRVAGVLISRNDGAVGAGGTIRIRGINSLTQGNRPLIYVDGVRIFSDYVNNDAVKTATSPLNDIDPNTIERMEVIKGAAATTLYGTEASNGVIQIFTKKGAGGQKPQWEFKTSQGFSRMGQIGPDLSPSWLAKWGPESKDLWMSKFLRDGPSSEYNLSVRGNSPGEYAINYFLSSGYSKEVGTFPNNDMSTTLLRGNFGFRPNKSLLVQFNSSWSGHQIQWVPLGNQAYSFSLNVMRGPYNYVGSVAADSTFVTDTKTYESQNHFTSGVDITYTPTDAILVKTVIGLDNIDTDYQNSWFFGSLIFPNGTRYERRFTNTNKQVDAQVTYSKRAFKWLTTATSGGMQFFDARRLTVSGSSNNFAGPGSPVIQTGSQQNASESRLRVVNAGYFFQELLGISDRLFITAGLRLDGNSAFGKSFGLQKYPKLSASYILSDFAFWPQWIEEAKVRAAYGVSGKAPGYFDAQRGWTPISANGGQPGVRASTQGNPNIGPERSTEIEEGFEAGMFNGRLNVDLSFYQQRTADALISVPQDPSKGFLSGQIANVGLMQNQGMEVAVHGTPYRRGDFNLELGVTASRTNSLMKKIGGPPISLGTSTAPGVWVKEGYAMPSYWAQKLLNPTEVGPMKLTPETYFGPIFPTKILTLSTTINVIKGLSVSGLAEFQGGHYNLSHTAYRNALRGVWPACQGVLDKIAATGAASLTAFETYTCNPAKAIGGAYLSKNDFWRVRSVQVSYDVPQRFTRNTGKWNVLLAGRNLFTITDYAGIEPEANDGGDSFSRNEYYQLPLPRTFVLSARNNF